MAAMAGDALLVVFGRFLVEVKEGQLASLVLLVLVGLLENCL